MNTQPFWASPADLKRSWKVLSKFNTFHSFFTNFVGLVFVFDVKNIFFTDCQKNRLSVSNSLVGNAPNLRVCSPNELRNMSNCVFWRYSIDFFWLFLVEFFSKILVFGPPWPPTTARSQKYFSWTRVSFRHETYLKNFLFGSKTFYFLTKTPNKPSRKGFNQKYFVSDEFWTSRFSGLQPKWPK